MKKVWSVMVFNFGTACKEGLNQDMKLKKQVVDDMMKKDEHKENILEPMEIFGLDSLAIVPILLKIL